MSFAIAGLAMMLLLAIGALCLESVGAYRAANRVAELNRVSNALYDALIEAAYERGRMNVLLDRRGAIDDRNRAFIQARRAGVDAGFSRVVTGLREISGVSASVAERLREAEAWYGQLRTQRAMADQEVAQPRNLRDETLVRGWFAELTAVLDAWELLADALLDEMRRLEPQLGSAAVLKQGGWQARKAAGAEVTIVGRAGNAGRALTDPEARRLRVLQTRTGFAWERFVAHSAEARDARLEAAVHAVSARYTGDFAASREALIVGAGGGTVGTEEHYRQGIDALNAFEGVMKAAAEMTADAADARRHQARTRLGASVALFVAATAVLAWLLVTLRRRAFLPLSDLGLLVQSAADGLVTFDGQGRIVGINEAAGRMFGCEPAAVAPLHLQEFLPELGAAGASLPEAFLAGRERRFERVLADGATAQLDLSVGHAAGRYTAVVRDVSAQHAAARALAERSRFMQLAEAVGRMGHWRLDLRRRELYWSDEIYRIHGVAPGDFQPTLENAIAFYHPDDRDTVRRILERALAEHGGFSFELRIVRPDGEIRHVAASGSCLMAADGAAEVMFAVSQDVTERRATEARVRASEERLRLALDAIDEGLWDWDITTGETIVGPRWSTMLGFEPGELPSTMAALEPLCHPDDLAGMRERLRRHLDGESDTYRHEHRLRHKSGRWIWVLARGRVVQRDAEGHALRMVGTHVDITARKQAERALRDEHARLQAILDNAAVGVGIVDGAGRYLLVNDTLCRMLGGSREAPPDIAALESDRPGEPASIREHMTGVLRGDSAGWREEARFVGNDGTVIWCDVSLTPLAGADGRVEAVIAVVVDVTGTKQTMEALRQARTRIDQAMKAGHLAWWDADVARGTVQLSDRWSQMMGGEPVETRATVGELLVATHPSERRRVLQVARDAVDGDTNEYAIEHRVRDRHGVWRWIASYGMVVARDRTGRAVRIIGVNADITERKRVERELIEAKELAEQASAAKSEFLSRMSHELRTPLNAILGFGQLLESDDADPLSEGQRSSLAQILKAGWHLLALIDEVLDLARIESGRLSISIEPVDLSAVARECAELVLPMAREQGLRFRDEVGSGEPCFALSDVTRLKQVLINLLSNAVKYNRPGGSVVMRLERPARGRVRIGVEDTGMGLTAEQLGRLYEPFNRFGMEKSGIQGTGIGLAIARRLTEAMRGELHVTSEQGKGSTFAVEMAAVEPGAISQALPLPDAEAENESSAASGTMLYVEDNPSNVVLMRNIIARRPGLRLITAHDGLMGLELAQAHRPDIIVIDIGLPGMDGLELCRRLCRLPETRDIPMIGLSANAMPSDIENARVAGFRRYMTKPVDLAELLDELDTVLAARRQAADSAA